MNKDIDLFISAQSFQEEDIRGKTVVIIDVLRASSTMVTAIENGAKGIIPVENMDMAGKISQNMGSPQYLLCGEKDGLKIEGYHLGNSPLEYSREVVRDKTIILNTTNGTKAVKKASMAEELIIGSFLNLKQVVNKLENTPHPITLICAGWRGQQSLEDLLCAGSIIYELNGGGLPANASDGVRIAFDLFVKYGDDIEGTVFASDHAVRLQGLIDPKDIAHSCALNKMNVLPILKEGIISNVNGEEKEFSYQEQRAFENSKA